MEWFESVLGPTYASALMWTGVALLGLIVLLILFRLLRRLGAGTFVSGGRNRKARLAIMDATAVDNLRRLVLVRRDDVEHLILIGGGNDLVVERDIRLTQPASPRLGVARDAADPDMAPVRQQRGAAPSAPAAQRREPAPLPRQEPAAPPPRQQAPRQAEPAPAPRPAPVAPPVATRQPLAPAAPPPIQAADYGAEALPQADAVASGERPVAPSSHESSFVPAEPPTAQIDLDDDLLQELQLTLDQEDLPAPQPQAAAPAREGRVDDEMDRLLGELSGQRR